MMRDLRRELELAEDERHRLEMLVKEAAIVGIWAFLELERTPGWRALRRRWLERLWREKAYEASAGRQLLKRAAP